MHSSPHRKFQKCAAHVLIRPGSVCEFTSCEISKSGKNPKESRKGIAVAKVKTTGGYFHINIYGKCRFAGYHLSA